MAQYIQGKDEDGKFRFETMVYFCEANDNKQLSLYDLLKITSDGAVEDYNQQGMSRDVLYNNHYAILVSRLSFHFHRMPKENEAIVFKTWEEKPEPLQLVRAYEIESKTGEKLVSGISSWILVDPDSRRIIPTKKFEMRPEITRVEDHECMKYGKIPHPEEAEMQVFDERIIKYSDLDGNGHTNNARYGAFVADALPEQLRHVTFTDFRLNYAKEAKIGQKLTVYGKIDEEVKKLILIGKMEDGTVSFEAELCW
ncbi:MAG: acyl-[acyl-carrier-protein] thioesterase [Treponema sp.]|nr:acyl-[acyl-carrier-protein] thioesterase [Candidatus Treponema equifaecale]